MITCWRRVQTHSIEDLVRRAFAEVGIDNWADYVRQDPKFLRPAEVDLLIGDASKARTKLGWEPEVDFPALVKMMVAHDLATRSHQSRHPRPRLTGTAGEGSASDEPERGRPRVSNQSSAVRPRKRLTSRRACR